MFYNIGGKIKTLAVVVCILGMFASIVIGFLLIMGIGEVFGLEKAGFGSGILFMIVGSLLSWVSTFVLYGFGQLVENSDILVERTETQGAPKKTPTQIPQGKDFAERVKQNSTLNLEHILQNPKRYLLYSEKELQLIREELESRKNAQQ